jgi:N-acetylglucosaminyl-diphospho-decaprenol L-rhamnosyltransferase
MRSQPIRHFIITRFNLRAPDASGDRQIDRQYLSERLDLFERFCLPTVRGQTRQDFIWLVLFDRDTPADIKQRIERHKGWPNFVPVYLPAGSEHVGRLVVTPYLDKAPQTLITTRLDNDDGLCRTYVEEIRRYQGASERLVLQCPVGYVWHRGRIYLDRQEHNAFTTLIEPLEHGVESEYVTIYKGSHSDIHRLGRVVDVTQEPAWLQVIHDTNVENYVRGKRQRIGELSARFDVDAGTGQDEGAAEIYLDRLRTLATSTATRLKRAFKYRIDRLRAQ